MITRVRDLVEQNPEVTGFMRWRAKVAGVASESPRIIWTPLQDVSPFMVCAVVKAEDPDYFRHDGIAWMRVRKALFDGLRGKGWRGASTITQQLARNLFLSPTRSLRRKAQEVFLAHKIEKTLSKARILELYLNVVEWGDGVWGIRAAAKHYLHCQPSEIGVVGATVLASLLPAPRQPLRDGNARRAYGAQQAIVFDMYGSRVLNFHEVLDAQVRLLQLSNALAAGVPLPTALHIVERPFHGRDNPAFAQTALAIIDGECGHDYAKHFTRFVKGLRKDKQKMFNWPLWWSLDARPEITSATAQR